MTGLKLSYCKDIVGKLVTNGDTIAYPCRRGASMWMEVADVVDITDHIKPVSYPGDKPERCISLLVKKSDGKQVRITSVDRIVKVFPTGD